MASDSDRAKRLVEYFITVGVGEDVQPLETASECNRAITDIRVISATDELPDGYEVLYSTMFGADARLNRGVWSMGGHKTYLCISRDAPGPPITDLILIFGDEGELCPAGYMKINHNLNMGQRGHDVYLCFTKDAKNPPLIDLQLIAPSENESFPSGYFKVSRSLHEGAYGTSLYICYKKSPTSKLDLSYKSVILDHYPKYDRPDSPLPQPVALFCQPQGAKIRSDIPLPTFNTFVLTTSSGVQTYGACVTFYERLVHDRIFRSSRRASAATAAIAYKQGESQAVISHQFNSLQHSHAPFAQAIVYAPKSICLLSYWPFYNCFKEFLTELYRIAMNATSASTAHPLPIEAYLANLWECPLPISPSIGVRLNIGMATIVFAQLPRDDFPLSDFSFDLIFRLLSLPTLTAVLEAVLAERKIILCSHHLSVLTPVAEALRALIFPFQWQYAYIPLLPVAIQGIVSEAPMPVLVGMHTENLERVMYSQEEVVVVDLDRNAIRWPIGAAPITPFPSPLKDTLKAELHAEANYGAIRPFTEVDWQLIDLAFSSSNMPVLPSQIIAAVDTRAANTTSPKASVSGVHVDVAATADSSDNKQFDVRAARACFLHMFVSLLQGFQQHLKHPSQNNDDNDPNGFGNRSSLAEFFEFQAFTDASSRKHRDYLIGLQQTQAFSKFVEDNLFPSTTQRKDELDFFFGCCAYEDSLLAHKTRTSSKPGLFSMFSSSKAPPPVSNLPSLVSHVTRRRCARDIYSVPPPQSVSSANSAHGFYYSEFPVLDLAQFPTPRPISFDRVADVDPARVALVRSEFNAAYGKQHSNGLTRSGGSGLLNGSVSGRWSDPRAWATNLLFQVYALWFDVSETTLLSSNAVASALPQSTPSLSLTTSFSASGDIVEVSSQATGDAVSSPLSDKSDTEVFAPPTSFTARRARSASVPYRPPAALQLSLISSGIPEEKSRADDDIRHSPAPPPLSARPWSPSNMFASPMVPPSPSSRASFSFAPPPQLRNADSTHSVERGLYLMFSVLRHMFVASVTPDEEVFRAILLVCGRHRKGVEAKEVLTAMRRSGFKPSQATYNAYAAAVAQAGGSSVSSVPLLFENSTPQSSIIEVDYDATAAVPADSPAVAAPALTFKIDWSQLCMGVGQKCPDCGSVLFEEDLMAMWRDEESSQSSSESMLLSPRRQQQPTLAAGHFLCPACDQAPIQPRLHVRLVVTSKCGDVEPCPPFVDDDSATPANDLVQSFSVTYMSPIKLRQRLKSLCDQSAAEASVSAANTWLMSVMSKLPERLSQSVDEMSEDETVVFNLLWYWANASLPLEFLTLPAEITIGKLAVAGSDSPPLILDFTSFHERTFSARAGTAESMLVSSWTRKFKGTKPDAPSTPSSASASTFSTFFSHFNLFGSPAAIDKMSALPRARSDETGGASVAISQPAFAASTAGIHARGSSQQFSLSHLPGQSGIPAPSPGPVLSRALASADPLELKQVNAIREKLACRDLPQAFNLFLRNRQAGKFARWQRPMFREINLLREGVIEVASDFIHLYRDALQWLPDEQKSMLKFGDAAPSDAIIACRTVFGHGDLLV